MKKIFFISTLLILSLQVSAQFKLVTKLGREFRNIKILSHTSDYIRFKRIYSGSIMKIYTENILQLSYNKQAILFKDSLLLDSIILKNHLRYPLLLSKHRLLYNNLDSLAKKSFLKGNMDAQLYFTDQACSPLIAMEGAIFGSVVSLITATLVSHKVPEGIYLFTNDFNQFNDKNYLLGYQNAALKIKRGKVWDGFFIGLTANVVTATTILILLR